MGLICPHLLKVICIPAKRVIVNSYVAFLDTSGNARRVHCLTRGETQTILLGLAPTFPNAREL